MESYLPFGKARERGQCHEIFYPGFLNQSTVSGISERCWIRERLNRRDARQEGVGHEGRKAGGRWTGLTQGRRALDRMDTRQEGVGQDGHKAGGRWTGRTHGRRDARRRDADRNLPL